MPVNRRRGEVEALLDGVPRRLVLTLGALAELEDAFGAPDLVALAERFERGRLSARDVAKILAAGLRGGGAETTDAEAARLTHADGAAGYVRAVADLLYATFGAPDPHGSTRSGDPQEGGGADAQIPFRGTR